jgi:Ni/Co efflux regulator RcnB
MKKPILIALSFGIAAGISLPVQARALPAQERGQDQRGQQQEQAHPQYHFRQQDAQKLRQNYKNINRVDVNHRGHFVAGERLPSDWHKRMHPVPQAVIAELPPPPPGYVFGYIDGYCVVYDPNTGYIADVIDLANLP